jgi:hypothetical protein
MNAPLRTFLMGFWSCTLVSLTCAAAEADRFLGYSGTATARHSDKFLYGERHVLRYRGERLVERVVIYTCKSGAPFARKTVSYVDNLAPDFLLDDVSNGMREGLRTTGDLREVFFRGDRSDTETAKALPRGVALVADTGFDEFVRTNWQKLMQGKPLEMHFLVPSRLADVTFQVQHLRNESVDGIPAELFRLNLSGMLGWVLPAIDVDYAASEHVLMRYVGLSDLRDASHDNFQTAILFRLDDRKPTDGQDMADMRRAPLTRCQ